MEKEKEISKVEVSETNVEETTEKNVEETTEVKNVKVYKKGLHALKYSLSFYTLGALASAVLVGITAPTIPFVRQDIDGVRMDKTTISNGEQHNVTTYVDQNSMYYNDDINQNAVYFYDNWNYVNGQYQRNVYKALLSEVNLKNLKQYALDENYDEVVKMSNKFCLETEKAEQIPDDLESGKKVVIYNMNKNEVQTIKESKSANTSNTWLFSIYLVLGAIMTSSSIENVKSKIKNDLDEIELKKLEEKRYNYIKEEQSKRTK